MMAKSKEIPEIPLEEFEPGRDVIRLGTGLSGEISGIVEIKEVPHVVVTLPGRLQSKIPVTNFGEVYRFAEAHPLPATDPEAIARIESLHRMVEQAKPTNTIAVFGLSKRTNEEIKDSLRRMLEEATANEYLFRGDAHNPTGNGGYEKNHRTGRYKGPFNMGFKGEGLVFVTPSIEQALSYPHEQDMPDDWDGKRYVYFIKPDLWLEDPSQIRDEDLAAGRLSIGSVAPAYVRYAVLKPPPGNKDHVKVYRNNLSPATFNMSLR